MFTTWNYTLRLPRDTTNYILTIRHYRCVPHDVTGHTFCVKLQTMFTSWWRYRWCSQRPKHFLITCNQSIYNDRKATGIWLYFEYVPALSHVHSVYCWSQYSVLVKVSLSPPGTDTFWWTVNWPLTAAQCLTLRTPAHRAREDETAGRGRC